MSLKNNIFRNLLNIPGWRTNRKIMVIESDDWGSIRMPSREVYQKLLKAGYPVNLNPFERYDSLASSEDLEILFELLLSFKDINGNHPVITANCVVANPDFAKIATDNFKKYHFELINNTFKKYPLHNNNLFLWKKANSEGIFHPQFHAREHLNVSKFMKALRQKDEDAHFGFENNMPGNIKKGKLNSGNQFVEATYYDDEVDKWDKLNIFLEGFEIFEQTFGYKSLSIIPPNYTWNRGFNKVIADRGVIFIQGQRKMREPTPGKDRYYHRLQGAKGKAGLIDLVRNVSFEPAISSVSNQVERTLIDMAAAFRMKKPAIISSHRINYVGFLSTQNRDNTLLLLKQIITLAMKKWPDIEFMTSDALGNLISEDYERKNH